MKLQYREQPAQYLSKGQDYLSEQASKYTKLPVGHPEGYLEAFSNIFTDVFDCVLTGFNNLRRGKFDFPDVYDGLQGVKFIEKCIESDNEDAKWVTF